MAFPLSDAEHGAIKARIDAQQELVVAAAVRVEPGLILIAERPGRHGNCINLLHWKGLPHDDHGFITNRGRFVGREEAGAIVEAAGQGSRRFGLDGLFSEDMWNDWDVSPRRPVRAEDVFANTPDQGSVE